MRLEGRSAEHQHSINGGHHHSTASNEGAASAAKIRYTYSVATKGSVVTDKEQFASVLAATYGDNRGWKLGGQVNFSRVASGGDLTIWISQASLDDELQ